MNTSNGTSKASQGETPLLLRSKLHRFRSWFLKPVLIAIYLLEETLMTALDDAVAAITLSVQNEVARVIATLGGSNPDVAAAITQLTALSATLDATDVAPPPPPAGP